MKSRVVQVLTVFLISDRLGGSASFVSCRPSLFYSSTLFTSSSEEWQHFPSREIRGTSAIIDERGYDAFITTLNIIDEGEEIIIDPIIWARTFKQQCSRNDDDVSTKKSESLLTVAHPPFEAFEAIESTRRWSENFVRKLKLCPWAGSSIDVPGGIRYWVVLVEDRVSGDDNDPSDIYTRRRRAKGGDHHVDDKRRAAILEQMEGIVRDAGKHLMQITTSPSSKEGEYNNAFDAIDPSVAISFVILVEQRSLPFVAFHEYFIDLEEKLLDECDVYDDDETSQEEDEKEDDDGCSTVDNIPIGCDITVAAFHPQWRFGLDSGNDYEEAVDFEKRAPYPTISIVRSSAIDVLMNDDDDSVVIDCSAPATRRIADQNEKTLRDIGIDKLRELFDAVVIKGPS